MICTIVDKRNVVLGSTSVPTYIILCEDQILS